MSLENSYAQATYDLIAEGMSVKEAVEHLTSVLEKKGHQKLERQVLRTLLRIAEQEESYDLPVLTVARRGDKAQFKKEIADALQICSAKGDRMNVYENKNLIGGFTLSYRGDEVDMSYKTKLLNLYRRVVM